MQEVLSLVGYQCTLADERSIAFVRRRMPITLDPIAKGCIVARTARVLKESGAEQVVDAGGDMGSVSDASRGEGWKIAIQYPRTAEFYLGLLRLRARPSLPRATISSASMRSGASITPFTPGLGNHQSTSTPLSTKRSLSWVCGTECNSYTN